MGVPGPGILSAIGIVAIRQQIGASLLGPLHPLARSPLLDLAVITAEKHIGDANTIEISRAGVDGLLQQAEIRLPPVGEQRIVICAETPRGPLSMNGRVEHAAEAGRIDWSVVHAEADSRRVHWSMTTSTQ